MLRSGVVRVGVSGWRYKGWRGSFYPPKLAQKRELEFASGRFNSIELNGSFYSLQRPQSFASWASETPENFTFAIKGSRYITHMLKLRGVETALANFFAQGLLRLGPKLGPILWQFPPNFHFDAERIQSFFNLLPRDQAQAAGLGSKHDLRLAGRSWLEVSRNALLRYAVEIRHESFVCEDFIRLLRLHNVGLVVADAVEWPLLMDVTSDFVYCRLHGSEELYSSGYEEDALNIWAERVIAWAFGGEVRDGHRASSRDAKKRKRRDVFVYFDNDMKVRAPFDAMQLAAKVEQRLMARIERAAAAETHAQG